MILHKDVCENRANKINDLRTSLIGSEFVKTSLNALGAAKHVCENRISSRELGDVLPLPKIGVKFGSSFELEAD